MGKLQNILLLPAALAFLCSGCATTPDSTGKATGGQTGLVQATDVEKQLLQSAATLEREIESGGFLYKDEELNAYLGSVLSRLLPEKDGQPRARVIKSPSLNAFALPNGAIYIHTGMLAKMENEAQLAAIMGHELVHFTNRHALLEATRKQERSPFGRAMETVMSSVGTILGGEEGGQELKGLVGDIRDMWVQASLKGYSREMETEADEEGLRAMVRAGYEPLEAPRVFELLKRDLDETKGREPFFFSTHPRLKERIDHYTKLIAGREAKKAGIINADEYGRQTARLLLDNAAMDIRSGRLGSAEAAVAKSLRHEPKNARAFFLRGEIHRREGGHPAAIDAYRQAAMLDPAYAEPHRELGFLYLKINRLDEAMASFERYLSLNPDAADAMAVRGHMGR